MARVMFPSPGEFVEKAPLCERFRLAWQVIRGIQHYDDGVHAWLLVHKRPA